MNKCIKILPFTKEVFDQEDYEGLKIQTTTRTGVKVKTKKDVKDVKVRLINMSY